METAEAKAVIRAAGQASDWPEWCVRQPTPGRSFACVWVHAPTAEEAPALTHEIAGLREAIGGRRAA